MTPRRFLRATLGFTLTQYLVRAALMLRGLVAAHLLGPLAYGSWNALTLIWDYGLYAHLGTQQGLEQALPGRIVDGDRHKVQRTLGSALFNTLALTALFMIGAFLYFMRGPGEIRDYWGLGGLGVALVCVLLVNLAYYHVTLLRSLGDIRTVSLWFVLQGTIGVALGLALIPWSGTWGLLWGWLVANGIALVFVRRKLPAGYPVMPRPSLEGRDLIVAGFPMLLYLSSSLVLRTLDRLIVLRFLGAESLGYYGLAVMALTMLFYLPDSIGFVLYPELLRDYRRGGDRPEAIRDRVVRTSRIVSLLVPVMCGIAFLWAREIVRDLLPKFMPGAAAMRILCFGAAGLAVARIASITLVTLRKQRLLFPAALSVVVLASVLDILMLRAGYGIEGVAWATLATYVAHGALMQWLASQSLGMTPRERLQELGRLYLPLVVALGIAYGLDHLMPWSGKRVLWLRLVRRTGLTLVFVAAYVALLAPLARSLGIRRLLDAIGIRGADATHASEEPVA